MLEHAIFELLNFAGSLGVADAKVFGIGDLRVEDRFRDHCREPRCPNYDTSLNCPPHSFTPEWFRRYIQAFTRCMAFKFDLPVGAMQGPERREVSLLMHETTAAIEERAKSLGFSRACGYSGGGCKRTFCYEHDFCAALQEGGTCRHPDKARPSLSGMGVNWHELSKSLGWSMRMDSAVPVNSGAGAIMIAGLVFLD